jgi:geranylgeranyl diphosphate synthase type I
VSVDRYLAAIDEEIRRDVDTADRALRPFYDMMRYHLGLDGEEADGGKRIRPLLCLLVHEGLGGDFRRAVPAAAALELLHSFTLIHDDIEDQDTTRRHRPTVWSVWGIPHAINAGDGMYALSRLAIRRLAELGVPEDRALAVVAALDRACVLVTEGQFLDISFEARADVTRERYEAMVERKTAALFRAAAEVPALLAGAPASVVDALRTFGERFGAAFQAWDDINGVWGAAAETGKDETSDLAKRKMTLPLVIAFARARGGERGALAELYARPAPIDSSGVRQVRDILDALGVRAEVDRIVDDERRRALDALQRAGLARHSEGLIAELVRAATGGV